jgi:hypothetical protein
MRGDVDRDGAKRNAPLICIDTSNERHGACVCWLLHCHFVAGVNPDHAMDKERFNGVLK